ncbi:MAG: CheR family methyltransferase, partial [Candidatus Muiribacteriaceae bacterium]
MNDRLFKRVCDLVYQHSGIHLKPGKEALVTARLNKRMRVMGIAEMKEYIEYIEKSGDVEELARMIDVITTNTTSFFREEASLRAVFEVVEQWIKAGQRKIRIWSAAASTGEEPYTIAIIIREMLSRLSMERSVEVKILATDINMTVLNKAYEGIYMEEKLKNMPKILKTRYFDKVKRGGELFYQVRPFLRDLIVYRQFNLLSDKYPLKGGIDVIFLRNVMIYFDTNTRDAIVRKMHALLRK